MDEEPVDDELRGLGMAAFHEHEVSVSAEETEAALVAVRSRAAAGHHDEAVPTTVDEVPRAERSSWTVFVAAAAVIALVAGGLVAVFSDGRNDTIVPVADAPAPERTVEATTPDTVPPVTTETTIPVPIVQQTIAVDATAPPPLLEPAAFAAVPAEGDPNGNGASVAYGPEGLVVKQPGTSHLTIVRPETNDAVRIEIAEDISNIVAGPGGVVYGLGEPVFDDDNPVAPRGFRFPAIAIVGDRAGETVAFAEVDPNAYLELPRLAFGNGPDGVIDRSRQVGQVLIEHVDQVGAPLDPIDDFPLPVFADVDGDGFPDVEGGLIETVDPDLSWQLDIRRDATHADTYVGPSPTAPTTDGRVIYFERIGTDLTPDKDFGPNAMPVIAILNPDGSGTWVRLPEDWDVVASDVWGTVLMRRTATDLEFALLDDALEPATPEGVPPSSATEGALAIPRNCVDEFGCTQLASTADGGIVAYDPTDATLRVYDSTGGDLQSEVPIVGTGSLDQVFLVGVGPDDVVYLSIQTPGLEDPGNDLLAIPLVGSQAGTVVSRWTGLDGSGDSTLVPRRAGLTVVSCCGPRVPRPSADAPIYRWVDRTGAVIESTAPSFDLTLGDAGSSLTRIDGKATFTRFTLPTVFQNPRDFPTTIATDDGGALALDWVVEAGITAIVDFNTDWPEFGIDNDDVYFVEEAFGDFGSMLLEPSGTVVVVEDDRFVRRTLAEIGTPGWVGTAVTDLDTATVTAPGLNDHITENQPTWAASPELFAYQLVPSIGPNELVTVEYSDPRASTITITTSGFLDDSVAASQHVITTEIGDEGLLRFVSGTYGFQCQPGRGHQDFSTELCV